MGAQATCGQFASDVQFVLRRTGPSLTGRPSSDSCPPPERCPIRASLPPKPRPALDRESPQKAPTFNLGRPRLASGLALPEPVASVAPMRGHCEDLQDLERRVQRNAAELGQEAFWEQELRREQAREREAQSRLQALSAATAEHAARLQALDAQARALEDKLCLAAEAPGPPSPTASATERLRQDLAAQERQSAEVQGSLALVSRALEAAEHALQVSSGDWHPGLGLGVRPGSWLHPRVRLTKAQSLWVCPPVPQAQAQELEELNRELRQCNLQQFIQQTGAAPGSQVPGAPRGRPGAGAGPAPRSPLTRFPHRSSCLQPEQSPSQEPPGVLPWCPV